MNTTARLIQRYFPVLNGETSIGRVTPSELADRYGTPLFAYDRSILDLKWDLLRRALPPEVSIYYSIKANPNQAILQHFVKKGAGLEIASAGEFDQARSAGCPAAKIIFAGPGKTEAELQHVLEEGIGEIHVESLREARSIASIAQSRGLAANVALRVNPCAGVEGGAMRMGGRSAPFGIDEEALDETLDVLLNLPAIDFCGIHLFTGTQILDYKILIGQYCRGIDIARRVAARLKRPLRRIDFGGGLGIPYFTNDSELDMDQFQKALCVLWTTVQADPLFSGTEFLVEPGRYLAGECGVYICRVTEVKRSRGKTFLIVDGGMNHHLAASGNLGQTIKRNFPVVILNKPAAPAEETVDVVGPLCTPLDTIARNINLPKAEMGDLIGVLQSGAYARAASPLGFLSHPAPPEVWVDSGSHRLIRRRGNATDYLRDQVLKEAAAAGLGR